MKNKFFKSIFAMAAAATALLSPCQSQAAEVEEAPQHIDVLLLTALPGSGKSEVRKYLSSLSPQECHEKFGIGETVQLDDYPYVHMMRRISDEMTNRGYEGMFFRSPALPFNDPYAWGALIHLVNEDYYDLVTKNQPAPTNAGDWLMARLDEAMVKAGSEPRLSQLPEDLRQEIAEAIEVDAQKLLADKNAGVPETLEGKTVVIEFARGGATASPMPLPEPYGYRYSFGQLSPEILEKASILYVWVSPEESRRKNEERADPTDPGSILGHCVPLAVMYGDYGTDDIAWLLKNSEKNNTITVEAHGNKYHLPLGRFDNRSDLTTFVRQPQSLWQQENVDALRQGLEEAFQQLANGENS
ncbi:MAG: hypothetical protein ACQEP8_06770 [Chlamydiota bacterium]